MIGFFQHSWSFTNRSGSTAVNWNTYF